MLTNAAAHAFDHFEGHFGIFDLGICACICVAASCNLINTAYVVVGVGKFQVK